MNFKKVILAAAIILDANAQWQSTRMNSANNFQRQRRFGSQYEASQQVPTTLKLNQQWGNNYRSPDSMNNMQPQSGQQWNGNLPQPQQYQRHQPNLVDYPFTVEFVDRRRQQVGGPRPKPVFRKGVKPVSNTQYDDENLIDYPFTVEFVSNMNYPSENQENMAQASNQDSFQFKTQQQRYQQNHHHFPANRNNGDFSRIGNPGSSSRYGAGGDW